MKSSHLLPIVMLLLLQTSCNPGANEDSSKHPSPQPKIIEPPLKEELYILKNTADNFAQMIKRQPENLPAFEEYGNLLDMHIQRINRLNITPTEEVRNWMDSLGILIPGLKSGKMKEAQKSTAKVMTILKELDVRYHLTESSP